MRRILLVLLLPLMLAACGAEPTWAPDADVQRAAYVSGEPPSITLYTMINNRSGEGGHAGMLIDSGQRVLFDPAGSWYNRAAPERNDLHYGMTPLMLGYYIDYHARTTFHVVEQKIYVSPQTAAKAMVLAQNYGAVPKAFCTNSITDILGQLPEFANIKRTFFPARLMRQVEKMPNVQTRKYYDDDSDDNSALLTQVPAPVAATN